ncbi:hypothetical protein COR50_16540 [Chitinophaga caeni]|uniref:Uncharacterized protein n=1 Tax=Chitinophaga caeni TaxID=2029983 RepID=A0A291QXJ9_9BACT|nr:DUF6580 family putative transport protein [Chitinophaga caeni]ATL48641.1 hypothetical protein COR50_16540 [Chitinophaga caeni]
MKKDTLSKILLVTGLIFLVSLGRIITNHLEIWNFTAIGACALFGGVVFEDKKYAYIVPILALFLSDLFLQLFTNVQGFYGWQMLFTYGAFIFTTWLATRLKQPGALKIFGAAIGAGLIFFLVTNFGTWLTTNMYAKSMDGLIQCYVSGIPFYKNDIFGSFFLNSLMGDVFYSGLLFVAYALIQPVFVRKEQGQLA